MTNYESQKLKDKAWSNLAIHPAETRNVQMLHDTKVENHCINGVSIYNFTV
jgi:hypothetical protein